LTRGGHFEPERASLAMIVAGNHAIIFHCMHYSGFQVLGTPLGTLENREYSAGMYRTGDYMRDLRLRPLAPCPVSLNIK
ncbi:hypothetical protein P4307_28025, partial [Brevibacillus porteri]|uniref:hypothetical protein n=1 Tax=Brevibacillus porteri TaxID=2126350 RepID=UPI002E24CC0A|nr:hypothetical protein [Brevibacillus porteri]